MYNDIPSSYIITDLKGTYTKNTFNGYKKTEVFTELKKNILSGNIEKSVLWGCELHCSNYTNVLYNKLVSIYIKEVNKANLKILPIVFNNLKYFQNNKKNVDLRNNQYFRNNISDLICLLTFSNKYKLPKLPKILSEDFNMKNNKSKMLSKNLNYIKHFIKPEDNKNIIIPISEIALNLYNKGISKSLENCLFWTSWIISYEKNFQKKNMKCALRHIKDIPVKLQNDFTWLLWEIILNISEYKHEYIQLLYKMYVFDFKKSTKTQKIDLIILAYMLIIDVVPNIDYDTPLILDSKNIDRIKIIANINYQYLDIILNKSLHIPKSINTITINTQSPYFSKEKFSTKNHMEQFNKPTITIKPIIKIQNKSKKTKKQNIISMEKTCKPTSIDKLHLDNYIPKPTPSKDTINNIFSLNNLINDTDKLII